MNSKRIRFSFLVLAVYAVLGVVGLYSQSTSTPEISVTDIAAIATSVNGAQSTSGGGGSDSVEWHSFLPGSFK